MDAPRPQALSHAWTLAILVAIAANDVLMASLAHPVARTTTWFPSVGLGIGLLALSPRRRWWWLVPAVAAVFAATRLDHSLSYVVTLDAAHVGQVVLGALLLTWFGRRRAALASFHDLIHLVMAAVVSSGAAAVVQLSVTGSPDLAWYDDVASVFAAHSTAALCLAALVLGTRAQRRRPGLELVGQATALAFALGVMLTPHTVAPFTFVPVPFLVWAALRFDLTIVVWELAGFASILTIATSEGYGPFAATGNMSTLSQLHVGLLEQLYVMAAIVVTLPVSISKETRDVLVTRVVADEERFRRNFTQSPLGMVFLVAHGGRLVLEDLNDAAQTILGARADDLRGRRLADVLDTVTPFERVEDELVSGTNDTWHGRGAVLARPTSQVEIAVAALVEQGDERTFALQLLDVTEEHEARRRLEAAYRLNDATLNTTACIILVADEGGVIRRVNAATRMITGYTEADLVGRPVWDCGLNALDRAETDAMFMWPNRSGYPMVAERASRTADGSPLRIVWNNNIVREESGSAYAVLTGVDVTAERSSAGLATHLLRASVSTALVGVDAGGRISLFNSGATHMLGWTSEEMLGRPFVELLDPAELRQRTSASGSDEAFTCLVGMIGDAGESAPLDWTWRTREGAPVIVSLTLSTTSDEVEERVFMLAVGRNVTAQRLGQRTLLAALDKERSAVDQLSRLDQAKDEFVSTVSHELRTPVTSIIGYTEMLRDGSVVEPHPDQQHMLESIARNGQRLVAICNDLLLLSGFEAGTEVAMTLEHFDLRECLSVAEESARALAHDRPLTVRVEHSPRPVVVHGDRAQLDRVLLNLVSNAVKFTEDGGTVTVRVQALDGNAVLTVRDTGIGIAAEDQQAVFGRFFRTASAQTRAIPGTGLGLSIVSGIVEAHGGRIDLESEPDVGTTFRVWLPEAQAVPGELVGG